MIKKIISGGQTGADRAAVARKSNFIAVPHNAAPSPGGE